MINEIWKFREIGRQTVIPPRTFNLGFVICEWEMHLAVNERDGATGWGFQFQGPRGNGG
jgi:hypothetical protein